MQVRRGWQGVLVNVVLAWASWEPVPAQGERGASEVWNAELLQRLAEPWRSHALHVAQAPQIRSTGRAETFPCRRELYVWLLEHPDWGYWLWQQLGARGVQVRAVGNGEFVGEDEHGNRMNWHTIYHEPGLRLWYVEATGRGKLLSQPAHVRALLLLRYRGLRAPQGQTGIRHQAELAAQVDARGWQVILRFGQQAAQEFARQCLEQVQLFFAGMAWYVTEHPQWAREQVQKLMRQHPEQAQVGEQLLRLLAECPDAEGL
ncbi:MAG: hypothetical protein RMI91_04720 [Gemmatales bacterium]|nr:hypothetical protein [Gemmatales bacterium]MDW7993939.1 hypothetical protein [Gemmatales bacterium]